MTAPGPLSSRGLKAVRFPGEPFNRWSGHGGGSVHARQGPSTRQQRHQCPCSTHCRSGPQPNRGKERDGKESLGSLNTLL
ncbi:unnamed protein product [Arctogadus glacialis]